MSTLVELLPSIAVAVVVVLAGWGVMRVERRRFRRRMERLPEEYRPLVPAARWVVAAIVGFLLTVGLAMEFLGETGGMIALWGYVPVLAIVTRPHNRRYRARVKAVIADVQRRAPSMQRSELEQLVKNLEAVHGSRVQPLRKLLA